MAGEPNMIDAAAAATGLAGDFARVAKSIRDKLAPDFPDGCTLDRVDGTCERNRCTVTITITIDANEPGPGRDS